MFRAAFPLPRLYLWRRTKTVARKGAYERTIYYEKDDFSYARTGLHQLDGRIRDGGTGEPMVIAPAPSVVATAQRQFVVNGKAMQLDSYMTENGTLMVPVRALAEALGFKVTWNNGEVNINDGEMQCDLRIGEENYLVYTAIKDVIGMSAPFTLGSAPVLKNDKTYVPVKLFVPLFGNNDAAVQITDTTVTIDKDAESGDSTEIPNPLTKHEDIASLETAIGFKLICPTLPDGYKADSFIDISGEVAEVNYTNGADTVRFRMKKGDAADISGN